MVRSISGNILLHKSFILVLTESVYKILLVSNHKLRQSFGLRKAVWIRPCFHIFKGNV